MTHAAFYPVIEPPVVMHSVYGMKGPAKQRARDIPGLVSLKVRELFPDIPEAIYHGGEDTSMIAAATLIAPAGDTSITALSFGDCSAIVRHQDGSVLTIGDALAKRAIEANEVAKLAEDSGVDPASTSTRIEFLPSLRESRNRYNQGEGPWILAPDVNCVDRAKSVEFDAPIGTIILLASDGFTALISDYGVYDAAGLIEAATTRGLSSLVEELRTIESNDPSGKQFARYKKSDDATAVLVQILP